MTTMPTPSIGGAPKPGLRAALGPWVPAIIVVFLLTHLIYLAIDQRPFAWDDAWYAETALRLNDAWSQGGVFGAAAYFLKALESKAPLIVLLPQPFLFLFGREDSTFALANAAAWGVASIYVALLARRLVSPGAAPLAVLMLAIMPLTSGMIRIYFVEMTLTALVAMTIYHWLASQDFTSRRHSICMGVAIGLGELGKVHFPVFIAGILLWAAIRTWRTHRAPGQLVLVIAASLLGPLLAVGAAWAGRGDVGVLLGLGLTIGVVQALRERGAEWRGNLAAAVSVAIWIPLPWYLFNGKTVLEFAYQASVGPLSKFYGSSELLDWAAIRAYWWSNLNFGIGAALAACIASMAILLVPIAAVRRATAVANVTGVLRLAAFWVIPAVIVFTSGRNRETRFIMPLFPAVALLYAALAVALYRRARSLAVAAVALHLPLVLASYLIFSFGGPRVAIGANDAVLLFAPNLSGKGAAVREPWPVGEVISAALEVARPATPGARVRATILTDSAPLNFNTLLLEAVRRHRDIEFTATAYQSNVDDALLALEGADALIYQEGPLQAPDYTNRWGREIRRRIEAGELRGWRLVPQPSVRLPNGAFVRYFTRTSSGEVPVSSRAEATCVLFGRGAFALSGVEVQRSDRAMRLLTRWVKVRPDASQYAIAAHIIDADGRRALNADYFPPDGAEAFARLRVGGTVNAVTIIPAGEWCEWATHVRLALYDMQRRCNADVVILQGAESLGDGFIRVPLPAIPASQPATNPTGDATTRN